MFFRDLRLLGFDLRYAKTLDYAKTLSRPEKCSILHSEGMGLHLNLIVLGKLQIDEESARNPDHRNDRG